LVTDRDSRPVTRASIELARLETRRIGQSLCRRGDTNPKYTRPLGHLAHRRMTTIMRPTTPGTTPDVVETGTVIAKFALRCARMRCPAGVLEPAVGGTLSGGKGRVLWAHVRCGERSLHRTRSRRSVAAPRGARVRHEDARACLGPPQDRVRVCSLCPLLGRGLPGYRTAPGRDTAAIIPSPQAAKATCSWAPFAFRAIAVSPAGPPMNVTTLGSSATL
jgi:hypothetical protein